MKFRHHMTDNAGEILGESFTPRAQPGATRKPNLAGRVLVAEFSSQRYRCEEEGGVWRIYDTQAGSAADGEHEFLSKLHDSAVRCTQNRAVRTLADWQKRNEQFYKR